MSQLKVFPLTPLDVNFLLSSDLKKLDLPNSITIHFQLKERLVKEKMIKTLVELDTLFPALKLSTQFDKDNFAWKTTNIEKGTYFSTLVSVKDTIDEFSEEEFLNDSIRNNDYDSPFEISICNNFFFYRQNHLFGDAMYAVHLIEVLFSVYFEGIDSVKTLNLAQPLSITLLEQNGALLSEDEQPVIEKDFHVHFQEIQPLESVKHQVVLNTVFSSDQLTLLESLREKISKTERVSINTLINVLLSYFFLEQETQNVRTYLSIPTHLSSYFKKGVIYPYNFVTNIDAYIDTPTTIRSLIDVMNQTQHFISSMQKSDKLLANVKKSFEKYDQSPTLFIKGLQETYVSWFSKIEQTYVISNLGVVDELLPNTLHYGVKGRDIFLSAPSIGAQPLTIFLVRVGRQINVSCTIDESRLEKNTVKEVLKRFSKENLEALLASITTEL